MRIKIVALEGEPSTNALTILISSRECLMQGLVSFDFFVTANFEATNNSSRESTATK